MPQSINIFDTAMGRARDLSTDDLASGRAVASVVDRLSVALTWLQSIHRANNELRDDQAQRLEAIRTMLASGIASTNAARLDSIAALLGEVAQSTAAGRAAAQANGMQLEAITTVLVGILAKLTARGTVPWRMTHISHPGVSTLKAGPGLLRSLVVNTPVAGSTIDLIDGTSGRGKKLATIRQSGCDPRAGSMNYGGTFTTGLTIVTSATDDITVTFR